MRVNGPGSLQTGPIRRLRKGNGGASGFADQVAANDGDPAPSQVRGPAPAAAIDSLLALQEVGDATSGRKRALARGRGLLDLLDGVRHGLLAGGISQAKLNALVTAVRSERDAVSDPRLAHVLDEIELRAAVEIAKYERA